MDVNPVPTEWADSPFATRRIAAEVARDSEPGLMPSAQAIAEQFGVSRHVATMARNFLIGRGVVRKSGRRYFFVLTKN